MHAFTSAVGSGSPVAGCALCSPPGDRGQQGDSHPAAPLVEKGLLPGVRSVAAGVAYSVFVVGVWRPREQMEAG